MTRAVSADSLRNAERWGPRGSASCNHPNHFPHLKPRTCNLWVNCSMSHSGASLPQLQAQPGKSPTSAALLSKSQASNGSKGSAGQRSQESSVLPAIAGSARPPADIPTFFHGHTHAQAVATGQVAALEPSPTENANASVFKSSVLAALQQTKGGDNDSIRSDVGSSVSDIRLRLFVKGVLPCFSPVLMEAYGAGVRDLGTASVDPDVAIPPQPSIHQILTHRAGHRSTACGGNPPVASSRRRRGSYSALNNFSAI
jgi:hypothetical protein